MPPIPITPSQPPEGILGSRVPPPPIDALKEVEGLLVRLRAEAGGATDAPRKARLLYEIAEIEERSGDEPAAARDYLSSFNADAHFRESVEGLLRLLERRRSLRNLGKLVEALGRAAETPDEHVRAKTLRAYLLEDVGGDIEAAKQAALEATAVEGAAPAEMAAAWLTSELIAARVGDAESRLQALAKRAPLAQDPTWRSLLLIDTARLEAEAGSIDAALETLRSARAEGAGATFTAAVAAERLARKAARESGDEQQAQNRGRAYAEALEVQAALIDEALASPSRGDALGVPRWARSPVTMVDAWLRAAEARSVATDDVAAGALIDRAREALARFDARTDADTGQSETGRPDLVAALIDARIRMAERTGDTGLAAQLAEERLASLEAASGEGGGADAGGEDAGVAAALAMRIAEHAASEGDVPRALVALATATAKDPACVPARALQLDLLADDEPSTFAAQLEALADHLPTEDGRSRALLLAAWVWGARAGDARAARLALTQAGAAGAPEETVARIARTLASLAGDGLWYEESTKRLLAGSPSDEERPMLWLELARARFIRGALDDARAALREVGATTNGAWLGRALEAFLPGDAPGATTPSEAHPADAAEERGSATAAARALQALDELATRPQPADVARGLVLMAAMRAHRDGDAEGALSRLRTLASQSASDVLVGTYVAELERSRGSLDEVAQVAERCAEATEDTELAASLRIEAALARWQHGDRPRAIATFESAIDAAPEAARAALAWAARGLDVDSLDARRRAIARSLDAGGDEATLFLERFATELAAGDVTEASMALAAAEGGTDPSVVLAAALARAAWSASEDEDGLTAALSRVSGAGEEASTLAAAEEHRRARAAGDPDRVLDASRAWFHGGGGLPAGVEWLASTIAVGSVDDEQAARRAIASAAPPDLHEALLASVALLHVAATPNEPAPLLVGESDAVRLVNLELAPPGSDPRRRLAALRGLDAALGPDAEVDAIGLSGWSWFVDGNVAEALVAFDRATTAHPDDLGSWEGLRAAAEATGDLAKRAAACEALGSRCKDDARGGAFWEEAGLAATALADDARAETAFFNAFARDATRALSFDRLFRRVRERKERDLLLELVTRRLGVSDDPPEIAKLFWEQARVLREKGDQEGALKALENVTMLEPDHIGALALTGEIAIRRGKFEEAAEALARLALLDEAPAKNRVTAGIAAVDLFENKLDRFDRALDILLALHRSNLSSLPVRERLARAAARTGSWKEATDILEELMHERPEAEGRVEAARLAMAIHRDRLQNPAGARSAIVKLLEEAPTDGEAIEMLLAVDAPAETRTRLFENARKQLVESLQRRPLDLPSVKRLAKVARALSDDALQQIALSVAITLGGHDAALEQAFAQVSAKKARAPQIALTEAMLKQVLDPGDRGPIARLFTVLGPTIAEALGPSLAGCGVSKRDRVDPRSGIALRNEIATWAGSFGIPDFDLYIGGKEPLGVQGVPGEPPALVVGAGVNAPLAPATRARVARELLGMARGSTIVQHRDETTIAAMVVASCNLAEVKVDAPSYAMLADVERLLSKAISRKTKKLLPELCQAVVSANADARVWSKRALASHNRVAVLASGDAGIVLVDALGEPLDRLPSVAKGDARVEDLLRFALSPTYIELRRALGLEGGSS